MKVVFLSNFMCIHQVPFCEFMYKKFGSGFCFVATEEIEKDRLSQGYCDMNSSYPFVIRAYESEDAEQKAQRLTDEADLVLIGNAPMNYVRHRLNEKKSDVPVL